jgi:hypothetical protein
MSGREEKNSKEGTRGREKKKRRPKFSYDLRYSAS